MKQLLVLVTLTFLSGCGVTGVSYAVLQSAGNVQPSYHDPSVQRGKKPEFVINPNAALITAHGASKDRGDCMPTKGGAGEQRDNIEVDAGPVNINAICATKMFFTRGWRMSSFDFVAQAGHTYTITATEKECMSLLDITSGETVIACEPYRQSE